MRVAAAAWLPLVMLLGLSACTETVGVGPNSVSRSGNQLLLAVCENVEVVGLEGTFERLDLDDVRSIAIKFEGYGKGASWMSTFGGHNLMEISERGWLQSDGSTTS